ncbi:CinA family protein [Agromyces sp. SYSU T0242]|uniref:CinA family protein n=1 Tax=Agromyces litoreus TaxID=3158561 RepID=UPI00339943F1
MRGHRSADHPEVAAAVTEQVADAALRDVTASLIAELVARDLRIAVAESLTGGLLCAELTRIPGASRAVSGAVVAYATPVKHTLLSVPAELLAERGPVDPEVARRMAEGVRHAVAVDGDDADVGIATTGAAGPDPQDGAAPGTVFVGIAWPGGSVAVPLRFEGDRGEVRRATVEAAVRETLARVIGLPAGR